MHENDENPIDVQDVHDSYLDEHLEGWRATLGPERVDAKIIEFDNGRVRISIDIIKEVEIDLEPETNKTHAALLAAIRERTNEK